MQSCPGVVKCKGWYDNVSPSYYLQLSFRWKKPDWVPLQLHSKISQVFWHSSLFSVDAVDSIDGIQWQVDHSPFHVHSIHYQYTCLITHLELFYPSCNQLCPRPSICLTYLYRELICSSLSCQVLQPNSVYQGSAAKLYGKVRLQPHHSIWSNPATSTVTCEAAWARQASKAGYCRRDGAF